MSLNCMLRKSQKKNIFDTVKGPIDRKLYTNLRYEVFNLLSVLPLTVETN